MNTKKIIVENKRHIATYDEQIFDVYMPDARFIACPSVSACRRRRDTRPTRKRTRWQMRSLNCRSRFSH